MKIDEIERLIQLVSENDIETLELKSGGVELRIAKNGKGVVLEPSAVQRAAVPPAAEQAQPAKEAAKEPSPEELEQEGIHIIKATMVGTFYRSPSPGADPFVEVGQKMRKGQVICIIEAMKIMNEIEAEVAGEVTKVFVEDAQPVEYGEPLFAVEPSK